MHRILSQTVVYDQYDVDLVSKSTPSYFTYTYAYIYIYI